MIFAKWKEPRKADVLDMEASAFFNACLHCHVASLGVVKGVSDNGDEKKSKLMYHTALSNAAAATVGLSKHYVNGSSFPQQPLTLNGKVLAEGYFDNFLTKAIDGLEEIKIVKYLPLQNKPIDKIFLVDPGVDELQSIASQSLGTHIKRCHLEQVAIESDYTRSLILYYKNGKVFDIPTTLNRLQGEGETVVNHALFWSTLKERIRAQRLGKYVDFINFEDLERMCEQA